MKRNIINCLILIIAVCTSIGCKHDPNYAGGEVSAYMSNFDLRKLHTGSDVTLNTSNMRGATSLTGIVVSDHSGHNLPVGLLIIQNSRPVGNIDSLRGIAIPIGIEAANYNPGDSVNVKIEGGVLKRQDGILQVTGIPASAVSRVATGKPISVKAISSTAILARPNDYESTLVAIVKASLVPRAQPSDGYLGEKIINDGFGTFKMITDQTATFANTTGLFLNANYSGIIFNKVDENGKLSPFIRIRNLGDVMDKKLELAPIVISGYLADPMGGDGNNEYVQFLATQAINFATTPYSVVFTNNANNNTPTGFPALGWATGGLRTYKFNLTSGTVAKGQYFYVGGSTKLLNGSGSTSLSSLKWIRSFDYTKANGDGFGTKNSNLIANSGNAAGFAVFKGINIDVNTAPFDAIFIGRNGSIYNNGEGYLVPNNDYYDKTDPLSNAPQAYFLSGGNTRSFNYTSPSNVGVYNMLGGVYDEETGKWEQARIQSERILEKTLPATILESFWIRITTDPEGIETKRDTIYQTRLKSQVIVP